jgi:hypothetical protein
MIYDYIVIGGGIAGLACAYHLSKTYDVCLLEKDDKVGGRSWVDIFEGEPVNTGAGVGRYGKDTYLTSLLNEMNMSVSSVPVKITYDTDPIDILYYVEEMKKRPLDRTKPFKENFCDLFGENVYKQFVHTNGYTDFEKDDVYDAVYNYGFEDNTNGALIFYVDWNNLSRKLSKRLTIYQVNVRSISKYSNIWFINDTYMTRNIVYATDIHGLSSYVRYTPLYKEITENVGCQSFVRTYAVMKGTVKPFHVIHTKTPLQKVIYLGKNRLMIAYADNESADNVKTFDKKEFEIYLNEVGIANKIKTFKTYYWECGTHYYKPLKGFENRDEFIEYAQHPEDGIYVVGEWISNNQGWVEGALESVEKIIKKIFSK